MPVCRRRASVLGQTPTGPPDRTRTVCGGGRVTVTSGPRAAHVGGGCTGTRVTRRALGISSVFLQGTRSMGAPVVPKTGPAQSGLSWSLVDYRDKVQALEQLNLDLEQQIRIILTQRAHSATSWEPIRAQWEGLYRQVSEWILSNARLMLESENVQNNADDFKDRLESQLPWRRELEEELQALHKVVDEASQTRVDLRRRNEELWAELQGLQLEHQQDVRGLYTQITQDQDPDPELIQTGLDQILDHIRTHWERVCAENRLKSQDQETKIPVSGLSPEQEQIEGLKTEVREASNKLQSLQAQTESLRALKRGLEASLTDARHWQDLELQNLGSVVSRLESELNQVWSEAETQRRDLETLLSNKQRLEQEVALYHALLQGEEERYSEQREREEGGRSDGQDRGPDQDQREGRDQDLDQDQREGRGPNPDQDQREGRDRDLDLKDGLDQDQNPDQDSEQQVHAEPGGSAPDKAGPKPA